MNNNVFNYAETIQEAAEYRLGRRAVLPAVYNEQRPNQMPIPRCEFNASSLSHLQSNEIDSTVSSTESEATNASDCTFGDYSNASDFDLSGLFDTSLNGEANVVSTTEQLVPFEPDDIETNFEAIDPLIIMPEDVKPDIEFLKMNSQDAEFIENILGVEEETNRDGSVVDESVSNVSIVENRTHRDGPESEHRESNKESVEAEKDVSNDIENPVNWEQIDGEGEIYMALCENMPKPCIKHVDFSVKMDDVISSKMPFATSVSSHFILSFKFLLFCPLNFFTSTG